MNFTFQFDSYFAKKYKKLITKDANLKVRIDSVLERLGQDPKDPKLDSHKVKTPKFGQCFSSIITGDLRLIWSHNENNEVEIIDLLDIGGHSGGGKVY
jgi:mRNA-degrading endonuclease YafQ of YafQ-DinJ toxin-antitoxin module